MINYDVVIINVKYMESNYEWRVLLCW